MIQTDTIIDALSAAHPEMKFEVGKWTEVKALTLGPH